MESNATFPLSNTDHRVGGEVDLIMTRSDTTEREALIFVEVRSRSGFVGRFGAPALSVNRRKRLRVCRAAREWMDQRGLQDTRNVRFDVVSVVWAPGEEPMLQHFPNAFPWTHPRHARSRFQNLNTSRRRPR